MKVRILSSDGYKTANLNRRKAIRERCFNCSGWRYPEVETCQYNDCPLFSFRMGRGKQNSKERGKAIKSYCLWCMAGIVREVSKCVSETCPLFSYRKTGVDRSIEIIEDKPEKRLAVNA